MMRYFILALFFLALSTSLFSQSNPVPFLNQPLVPSVADPGGPKFTLTLSGTGLVPGAIVNWNGSPRPTTFISGSKITASISASDVSIAGTASVTVRNPSPGGGLSNCQYFQISNPIPSLSFKASHYAPNAGVGGNRWLLVNDFNNDGILDLAAPNDGTGTLSVLLGNGDGTFQN